MKIRNNKILIAVLCFVIFYLGACGYSDSSDSQGSIIINFQSTGARYAVTDNDKTTMIYKITLTGPGKDTIVKTTGKGDTSISIQVSEGTWNIQVQAEGDRVIGEGKAEVVVTAGNPAVADIKMTVTGTRVSSWAELVEDFKDTALLNHSIEIVSSLITSSNSAIELKGIKKTITLWAKKDVSIRRHDNMNNNPVFLIEDCTLILDGTKGGNITIYGNNNVGCTRALINVERSSTLRMLDGVTITKNISAGSGGGYGGGIYVKDGAFYMEGGTISGNTAKTSGGGVHIESGTFVKTGGIIYGNNEGDNSNLAKDGNTIHSNSGHAVYVKSGSVSINGTLSGNYPTAP